VSVRAVVELIELERADDRGDVHRAAVAAPGRTVHHARTISAARMPRITMTTRISMR